ncbi:MAG TPA: HxsD-like protein [Polyangiaceae bacterium]
MTPLRLHREIYRGNAVDEALGVFASYGTFERREEAAYWVVEITARTPERERRIAGELGNYALGLTTKGRKR